MMSLPATYTWPLVARYSRRISRRKVDLPDPEVPTRNTNSPFSTSTLTFLRAARCCPSYTFETSSNLITAHPGPGSGTRKFLRFLSRPRPSVCVGSSGPRHDARGDEKPVSPLRASVLLHAPTHSGVDEAVDVPVEHGVGVADLMLRTKILDHLVRVQNVAAHLRAPRVAAVAFERVQLGGTVGARLLEQPRLQHSERRSLVLQLRLLVLAAHHDAGREVGDTDRGGGGVNTLAARPGRPDDVAVSKIRDALRASGVGGGGRTIDVEEREPFVPVRA